MGKFGPTHITIVIVTFLVSIVALAATNHDTATFITIGMLVLAGIGVSLGQQQAVKEQTNGNTTRLMQMLESSANAHMEQMKMVSGLLALMTPGSPEAEAKMIELATTSPTTAPVNPPATVPITEEKS